ncbi:MAG: YciI family protein [Terriglobia bacterium]
MKDEPTNEQQERMLYRELPREEPPPPALEEQVVAALRRHGLLAGRPRLGFLEPALGAAAGLVVFLAGLAVGFSLRPAAESAGLPPSRPHFLLLLRASPDFSPPASAELARRVEEYGHWAREEIQAGNLLGGEKLQDTGFFLRASAERQLEITEARGRTGAGFVQGYFLIQASDYDQALRIARGCPHLRYGGTIELRAIDAQR